MNKVQVILLENGFEITEKDPSMSIVNSNWFALKHSLSNKECLANKTPPKMWVSEYPKGKYTVVKDRVCEDSEKVYSASIHGMNNVGWINIEFYPIFEDDILNNYQEIENRLIKAWEASWSDK